MPAAYKAGAVIVPRREYVESAHGLARQLPGRFNESSSPDFRFIPPFLVECTPAAQKAPGQELFVHYGGEYEDARKSLGYTCAAPKSDDFENTELPDNFPPSYTWRRLRTIYTAMVKSTRAVQPRTDILQDIDTQLHMAIRDLLGRDPLLEDVKWSTLAKAYICPLTTTGGATIEEVDAAIGSQESWSADDELAEAQPASAWDTTRLTGELARRADILWAAHEKAMECMPANLRSRACVTPSRRTTCVPVPRAHIRETW